MAFNPRWRQSGPSLTLGTSGGCIIVETCVEEVKEFPCEDTVTCSCLQPFLIGLKMEVRALAWVIKNNPYTDEEDARLSVDLMSLKSSWTTMTNQNTNNEIQQNVMLFF